MDRIREDKLKKPSELGVNISQSLEKVLMYGMAVFHENRCQNMTELMDMTKRALNSERITINKKDTVSDEINKTKMADEVYRTQVADEIYNNRSQDRYVSEEPMPQSNNGIMFEKSSNQKQIKKKAGLIVGIIVVVIAIVGVVVAFGVLGNNSNNKSIDDNPSTVVETTEEQTTVEETTEPQTEETTQEPETIVLVQVPDVEGMKSDDAIDEIERRNLKYNIKFEESDRIDLDYVISQSPVGGREVEEGEAVTIYISKTSLQPETEEPTTVHLIDNGSTMLYCRASDFATLRESPSRSSKSIIKILTGERVDKLGESGDFYYVRFGNDTGYVLKDFFSRDPNAPLNYDDGNPD